MLRLLHGSLERRIKTENARELHFFVLRGGKTGFTGRYTSR
jgi:hypothetical protein